MILVNKTSNEKLTKTIFLKKSQVKISSNPYLVDFQLWAADSESLRVPDLDIILHFTFSSSLLLSSQTHSLSSTNDNNNHFFYGNDDPYSPLQVCNQSVLSKQDGCLVLGVTYPTISVLGKLNNSVFRGKTLFSRDMSSVPTTSTVEQEPPIIDKDHREHHCECHQATHTMVTAINLQLDENKTLSYAFVNPSPFVSNGNLYDSSTKKKIMLDDQACTYQGSDPWTSPTTNFTYNQTYLIKCGQFLNYQSYLVKTFVRDNELDIGSGGEIYLATVSVNLAKNEGEENENENEKNAEKDDGSYGTIEILVY
jgi:hypothetical protein